MRNIWMVEGDSRRCDFVEEAHESASDATSDDESGEHSHESASHSQTSDDESHVGVPLVSAAAVPTPLHELARREPYNSAEAMLLRSAYCVSDVDVDVSGAKDFLAIQDKWEDMLQTCKLRFSPVFWKFFLKMHTYAQVVVDTALNNVREMDFFPADLRKQFPASRRNLMRNLRCIVKFWSLVRHTYRIDLRPFDLPSGKKFLTFQFIDPIWAWLLAARRNAPSDLHWKPHAQHRTSSPMYGGGVQYGECFKHAYVTRPEGSHVMMMALHWDGTYGRSLDVTPIAVGVGNINNCDTSKEMCIGYMPFTDDQKRPEFAKTSKCTR